MSTVRKSHLRVLRVTTDAMLAALFVVLSLFLSIKTPLMEISLVSLPILLCAFYCGTVDAVVVAFIGTLAEQLFTYGIGWTTPFWMAPVILQAFFAGLLYKCFYEKKKSRWRLLLIIFVCELLLNLANTFSLVFLGYTLVGEFFNFLFVVLPMRLLPLVERLIITGTVLPLIMPVLERQLPLRDAWKK